MTLVRRAFLTAFSAALAGCAREIPRAAKGGLDTSRLAAEFPALAARALPGVLNAGVMALAGGETWTWDASALMPMQSVFKAPLAAAALAEVDAGHLKLNEAFRLTAADLSVPFSLINQAWPTPPEGHTLSLPTIDLIALAVQRSDNTAADTVMKRLGGPAAVTAWLRLKGIEGLRVDRYERVLQQDVAGLGPFQPAWKDESAWRAARGALAPALREAAMNAYLADPRDTTTIPAALAFLAKLNAGALLSPTSTALLLRLMTDTPTGVHRLRAGLPAGSSLAHKTGTSGTDLGLTPAMGDIGLATLPDGRRFAAAAFLTGSTSTEAARERLFADAARLMAAAFG